jgi:hypothetical protein
MTGAIHKQDAHNDCVCGKGQTRIDLSLLQANLSLALVGGLLLLTIVRILPVLIGLVLLALLTFGFIGVLSYYRAQKHSLMCSVRLSFLQVLKAIASPIPA